MAGLSKEENERRREEKRKEKPITLHIGFPKSGSTTIQRFFLKNAAALKATYNTKFSFSVAIKIFNMASGYNVVVGDSEEADIDSFFRDDTDAFILSQEKLGSKIRTVDQVREVKNILQAYSNNVRIFCYVRSQDEVVRSAYVTSLLGGSTKKFGEFDVLPPDYWNRLKNWIAVFGKDRVFVRKYGTEHFKNGDLMDDVCEFFDFDTAAFTPVSPANVTPCLEVLEFQRLMNLALKDNEERRHIVKGSMYAGIEGRKMGISKANRKRILKHYQEGNLQVAREFFDSDVLFAEKELPGGKSEIELSAAQIEELTQKILGAYNISYEAQGLTKAEEAVGYVTGPLSLIRTNNPDVFNSVIRR